jgi:glycosyltransferase involved in cell wall biosynthesis
MKVSIITTALDAAETIADTLRSVAAQTYPHIEHIVVDGQSKDATMAVVHAHATPHLRAISEPDRGIYDAMNKGLAMATGDLIGFLNSDDFFTSTDAVAVHVDALERHADAVCGATVIVAANDPARITRFYPSLGFRPWMLRFGHMPPHPAFYVRRAAFERVGPFDPNYRIGADLEWMIRFFHVNRCRCTFTGRTLVAMREGGISNRGLRTRILINREALRSCHRWGLRTNQALLWSRYLVKTAQIIRRPVDFPPSRATRFNAACRLGFD